MHTSLCIVAVDITHAHTHPSVMWSWKELCKEEWQGFAGSKGGAWDAGLILEAASQRLPQGSDGGADV